MDAPIFYGGISDLGSFNIPTSVTGIRVFHTVDIADLPLRVM